MPSEIKADIWGRVASGTNVLQHLSQYALVCKDAAADFLEFLQAPHNKAMVQYWKKPATQFTVMIEKDRDGLAATLAERSQTLSQVAGNRSQLTKAQRQKARAKAIAGVVSATEPILVTAREIQDPKSPDASPLTLAPSISSKRQTEVIRNVLKNGHPFVVIDMTDTIPKGFNSHLLKKRFAKIAEKQGVDLSVLKEVRLGTSLVLKALRANLRAIDLEELIRVAHEIKSLIRLDLSRNTFGNDPFSDSNIDNSKVAELGDPSLPLTHLTLSGCGLGIKSAEAIASMLRKNTTLEYLDLSENQFSDLALELLAKALMENQNLRILRLHNRVIEKYNIEHNKSDIIWNKNNPHLRRELKPLPSQPAEHVLAALKTANFSNDADDRARYGHGRIDIRWGNLDDPEDRTHDDELHRRFNANPLTWSVEQEITPYRSAPRPAETYNTMSNG